MDVVVVRYEMERSISPFPIPIFTLAEVDYVSIDTKTNALLPEQLPALLPATLFVAVPATIAVEATPIITITTLRFCGRRR